MPAINVRFSEDQHEELRSAAFHRGRGWSIQKEILQRCFGNGETLGEGAGGRRDYEAPRVDEPAQVGTAPSPSVDVPEVNASVPPRPVPGGIRPPASGKRSFRPDPKGRK